MSDGVDFDGEMAGAMERLYATASMTERRRLIRDRLDLAAGESVLSIGTGPGFEAAGLAESVGPEGHVLGVDLEEAMLAAARERCADYPWVDFEPGDAADLPVEDGAFDAAAAVQVYEYVPDLEAALAELNRALRPGGRAVVFDTDWDTLTWHAADEARAARVVSAFDVHCPHPRVARTLGPRLSAAGFEVADPTPFVHLDLDGAGGSVGQLLSGLVARVVTERAGLEPDEVEAWEADLRDRAAAGEYFFSLNQYAFLAEKPA